MIAVIQHVECSQRRRRLVDENCCDASSSVFPKRSSSSGLLPLRLDAWSGPLLLASLLSSSYLTFLAGCNAARLKLCAPAHAFSFDTAYAISSASRQCLHLPCHRCISLMFGCEESKKPFAVSFDLSLCTRNEKNEQRRRRGRDVARGAQARLDVGGGHDRD